MQYTYPPYLSNIIQADCFKKKKKKKILIEFKASQKKWANKIN